MSQDLETWIAIVGVALTAVVTRASFAAFGSRAVLPPLAERALRFAPAAVLGAIVAPALLLQQGHLALGIGNQRLIAALVTSLVIWRWRNMIVSLAAGMAVLTLMRLYAPS
jgi:branched-subunit amino acid transport protein